MRKRTALEMSSLPSETLGQGLLFMYMYAHVIGFYSKYAVRLRISFQIPLVTYLIHVHVGGLVMGYSP